MERLSASAICDGIKFYPKPVLVPQRLTYRQAQEYFDRGLSRVYGVPAQTFMYPEDITLRIDYSYHKSDWWKLIIPKSQVPQWSKAGFFATWDRIEAHCRRQCNASRSRRRRNQIDWYHFIKPEIQRVPVACKVAAGKAYELRYSPNHDFYYFNYYVKA